MPALLVGLAAYALGCFSTGYYLVHARTGQDLRTIGSGSTGGRNVGRVLGPRGFFLTGAGDLGKTALAVAIPAWLALGPEAVGAAIVGVTMGHVWPLQLGFRGGKGLAPLVGASIVVVPLSVAARVVEPAIVGGLLAALVIAGVAHRSNIRAALRGGRALRPTAAAVQRGGGDG